MSLGHKAKLYINTASNASPVWAELERAIDVSTPLSKAEVDVSRRGSNWKLVKGALKEGSIEFGYRYLAGADGTDADYEDLLDSFANNTPLQFAAMDGPIAGDGARGFKAYCEVMELPHDEPLTDGQVVNVVAKPTDYYVSGSLIQPELVVIDA